MNKDIVLNTLLSNIESIIYFKDLEGHYTIVNDKLLQMFDLKREDIIGKKFFGNYTEEMFNKHFENDQQIINENKITTFVETAELEDGLHYYLSTKFPVLDKNELIGVGGISKDITEQKQLEHQLIESNKKLSDAISKVKLLSGFLPICSSCKKVRDDEGYWTNVEEYIKEHSNATFSHGICPPCRDNLYPEYKNR